MRPVFCTEPSGKSGQHLVGVLAHSPPQVDGIWGIWACYNDIGQWVFSAKAKAGTAEEVLSWSF